MTPEQKAHLRDFLDHFPEEVGWGTYFDGGMPCCTAGHMMKAIGAEHAEEARACRQLLDYFGIQASAVVDQNDEPMARLGLPVQSQAERAIRMKAWLEAKLAAA